VPLDRRDLESSTRRWTLSRPFDPYHAIRRGSDDLQLYGWKRHDPSASMHTCLDDHRCRHALRVDPQRPKRGLPCGPPESSTICSLLTPLIPSDRPKGPRPDVARHRLSSTASRPRLGWGAHRRQRRSGSGAGCCPGRPRGNSQHRGSLPLIWWVTGGVPGDAHGDFQWVSNPLVPPGCGDSLSTGCERTVCRRRWGGHRCCSEAFPRRG